MSVPTGTFGGPLWLGKSHRTRDGGTRPLRTKGHYAKEPTQYAPEPPPTPSPTQVPLTLAPTPTPEPPSPARTLAPLTVAPRELPDWFPGPFSGARNGMVWRKKPTGFGKPAEWVQERVPVSGAAFSTDSGPAPGTSHSGSSDSGSGSDPGTASSDSGSGPGTFGSDTGSASDPGTSGLVEAMLLETPSMCRDDLIGAGGVEVEVEMEARPDPSVGHRVGNEAGGEEVFFHPWHCPRPPVPDLGPCVSCGNPGVIGCAGCLEIFCGDCYGTCLDCRVG